jgi:hypothetical protein
VPQLDALLADRSPHRTPDQSRKYPVEGLRECLSGPSIIGRWTRCDGTCHPQRFHEITHRQALADGLGRMLGTTWVEDRHLPWHQQASEWDVLGNHQVSWFGVLSNVLVCDIGTSIHPDGPNERISGRRLESLIGYQNCLDTEPLGSPEHKLLHVTRGCIRVYPDFQRLSFEPLGLNLDHRSSGSTGRCDSSWRARSRGLVPSSSPVGLT